MVNQSSAYTFFVTVVYASCDSNMRMDLWEELFSLSNEMYDPLLIGGDFNIILEGGRENWGLTYL